MSSLLPLLAAVLLMPAGSSAATMYDAGNGKANGSCNGKSKNCSTSGSTTTGSTTTGSGSTTSTTSSTNNSGATSGSGSVLSRTWSVCGGPTKLSLLCATIDVQVAGTSTVLRVKNFSGDPANTTASQASAGSWVLTTVGFDGVAAASGVFTSAISSTTGPWWKSTPTTTTTPPSWVRFDDTQFGGGVNVDFGIDNGTGINAGIASGCAATGSLPGGSNRLWMTSVAGCAGYALGDATANAGWVETRLTTVRTWDPTGSDVSVYFKGQNGPNGISWECDLGDHVVKGDCAEYDVPTSVDGMPDGELPTGSVVPEPRTFVLMATGLLALALPPVRRRLREVLASRN